MVFFAILVFCHDALWVQQIWYFIILICHLGWAPSLLAYASMQKDSYFSINQVIFHYLLSWISNTEIKYHFLYKTFILNVSPKSCLKNKQANKKKKESQFVTLSGLDINLFCPDILVFSILYINVLWTSEKVTPVSEASGQFAGTDFLEFRNVNKPNKTTTTKNNLIPIVLSQNFHLQTTSEKTIADKFFMSETTNWGTKQWWHMQPLFTLCYYTYFWKLTTLVFLKCDMSLRCTTIPRCQGPESAPLGNFGVTYI